jgi:hypothetical protein
MQWRPAFFSELDGWNQDCTRSIIKARRLRSKQRAPLVALPALGLILQDGRGIDETEADQREHGEGFNFAVEND